MRLPALLFSACLLYGAPSKGPSTDKETLTSQMIQAIAYLGPLVQAEACAASASPQTQPDFIKALDKIQRKGREGKAFRAIRAKAKKTKGEQRAAYLMAEARITLEVTGELPPTLQQQIVQAVPPTSPAWALAEDRLMLFRQWLGKDRQDYCQKMEQNPHSDVQAVLQAAQATTLIDQGEMAQATTLVAQLEKKHPRHHTVKEVAQLLAKSLLTVVGKPAPAFEVPDLDHPGTTFTLTSFKGKYLLLDFWGTWCGFCVDELPNLHEAYNVFHSKGLEILSLACENQQADVVGFREKAPCPMPWKHAFIPHKAPHHPILDHYGITAFPSAFLIGPDGLLLAKGDALRGNSLQATLAKHLKRSRP